MYYVSSKFRCSSQRKNPDSSSYSSRHALSCEANHGSFEKTLKMIPLSGQTTAINGQKIILTLPPNSLVDLSTFEMNFVGATQHSGNSAGTNVAIYVQKAYFPRNAASLIEILEMKIDGQSRQNIINMVIFKTLFTI
jgi:hypothetical protein